MAIAAIIVLLVIIIVLLFLLINKKQEIHITHIQGTIPEDEYWDGPVPTLEQRRETWNWLIEHFQQFPNSGLKENYPHLHKVAMATVRYREIELMREREQISQDDYDIELEKILPLISISDDLNPDYNPNDE